VNVKCALNKCFGELRILSGNKYYDPLDDNRLTLDYIFKNASDEELEAIVHSIYGRICDVNEYANGLTDKELHKLAKELRKPQ